MHGKKYEYYIAAKNKNISQEVKQKNWDQVNRNDTPPCPDGKTRCVIKFTWSFKLKHLPDYCPLKYKASYCVYGDIQTSCVECIRNLHYHSLLVYH